MYLIVTTNQEFAEEAKKKGAKVFVAQEESETVGRSLVREMGSREDKVMALLQYLGFKFNLKGYDYIKEILVKCMENPHYHKRSLTKEIFPTCAKKYGSTWQRVERAVRHSIEKSYEKVPKRYDEIFKMELEGRPTNDEFISMMSEYLRQQDT